MCELGDPDPRRLRLSQRIPRRALLARRAHHRDLRRHDRGAENGGGGPGIEGTGGRRFAVSTSYQSSRFQRVARIAALAAGRPATFLGAVLVILVWAATGPWFRFSDTWQL